MNNGHMSIASIPAAMPVPAREAPAAAAEATEGASKSGSNFATLLRGQQASPQKNAPAEAEQTEQSETEIGRKADILEGASESALAAYLQLAVIPAPAAPPVELLPVDTLQNVAMSAEPVTAQKQQQPEDTRTAGGDVLSAQIESPTAEPAPQFSATVTEPDPITADVTVAPVSMDKILNETGTIRQQLGSEPQTEKVADAEASATLHKVASGSAPMVGSEESSSSNSDQGGAEGAFDNPDTALNLPGQLAVAPHKMAAVTTTSAPLEPLRQELAEQVMPQIKERLDQHDIKPGKQQITLTLSPDTLGELKMNLNLQGGKLSIEIVTESRSVRDAIMQHADTLKESLARQNITMESFDVTTGGKGSGNQGQNQNAWRELMQQQQQQQQYWTSPRGYGLAQADLPSEVAIQQRHQGQSMLDSHY